MTASALPGIGIEEPWEFRAALREFVGGSEAPKERDKDQARGAGHEIGRRNDGLDFFPTTPAVVRAMMLLLLQKFQSE